MERGRITLHGAHAYDHVCVRNGGTLAASDALTLFTGALYVARDSRISADGADGVFYYTHDCDTAGGQAPGSPGVPLTIIAAQAVIHGAISANGGRGIDDSLPCGGGYGAMPIGCGGDAGSVALMARTVVLDGSILARGGDGGAATAKAPAPGFPTPPPSHDPSGDGGRGGGITLIVARPDPSALRARLSVAGGHAGRRGTGPRGADGVTGAVQIRALSPSELDQLPSFRASLATAAASAGSDGALPQIRPLDARFAATHAMRCGAGDLRVRRGEVVRLAGAHRYPHVCVYRGGVLATAARLTLTARTILVEAGGRVTANGARVPPTGHGETGRYETAGACTPDHTPPHVGVPGAVAHSTALDQLGMPFTITAAPGAGGGRITLRAGSLLMDGSLSALGGIGQGGRNNADVWGDTPNFLTGAGGGSGGSVLIVAHEVQISGRVSVAGGAGGRGASGVQEAGQHGGPGCIKLFATVLRSTGGNTLPRNTFFIDPSNISAINDHLVGSVVVGRLLPNDLTSLSATQDTQFGIPTRATPSSKAIAATSVLAFTDEVTHCGWWCDPFSLNRWRQRGTRGARRGPGHN